MMMSFRESLLQEMLESKPIYSRHDARVEIGDLLYSDESVVFGLEKRDALLKSFRTRWFLTEMKFITITTSLPFNRAVDVYLFEDIMEMKFFEDDDKLVFSTQGGDYDFSTNSENERHLARQAVEQWSRFKSVHNQDG